jgi:tRNA-specific adenosine deaminase 3
MYHRVIKENIEGQDSLDLQHLRRFAKPKFLPPHVLGERDRIKELYLVPRAWEETPPVVMQANSPPWEWSSALKSRSTNRPQTLFLLVCPAQIISLEDLHDLLLQHPPFCSSPDSWAYPLEIKEVTVPMLAPTSPEQADRYSEDYWPTFYRKTNPFGAHPTNIGKAEEELQQPGDGSVHVEQMMELADKAGATTEEKGFGLSTGCVIVERVDDKTEIIAVAGDARRKPLPSEGGIDTLDNGLEEPDEDDAKNSAPQQSKSKKKKERRKKNKAAKKAEATGCTSGNVMAHSVMRALGMVGRKRLRCASQPMQSAAAKAESNFAAVGLDHDEKARDAFFLDLPITPLEQEYFVKDNIKPDGYLCLKLEVFLTHEPCMMCSMALVHSRVGRVIFKHRMPKTGGLTAEMARNDSGPIGLGYGLCWRKELNWQFMCWEWTARVTPEEKKLKALLREQQGESEEEDDDDDNDYDYDQALDKNGDSRANVGNTSFASVHA